MAALAMTPFLLEAQMTRLSVIWVTITSVVTKEPIICREAKAVIKSGGAGNDTVLVKEVLIKSMADKGMMF